MHGCGIHACLHSDVLLLILFREELDTVGYHQGKNIKGLRKIGRIPALVSRIREHHIDIVGIVETKKEFLSKGLLRSLTGSLEFVWCYLPAKKNQLEVFW